MCNKNDYKPFAFAIKLIILENFLITLPAVVCSLIFKDLVVFQKIIIMGNIISVALSYITFLMGLIFYIPKNTEDDNAIIKFFNFIVEIFLGSIINTTLWSSIFWFLSFYHFIPAITDGVRLLGVISFAIGLPFVIPFYIFLNLETRFLKCTKKIIMTIINKLGEIIL